MIHGRYICSFSESVTATAKWPSEDSVVWLNQPLSDILSTRSKVAVLRVLSETSVPLNGREIARRAGLVPGHAHRVLADLVAAGLVLSRDQGRANTYEFADPQSLISQQLRELFAAEIGRRREVIEALTAAEIGALSVILFGSEARGDAKPGSDTDLLIVVEKKTQDLEDRLSDILMRLATKHQLALSWLVTDANELQEWQAEGNEFLRNVQAEAVRLAGKPLERLLN
jgi:predicted nucleotidyltransferase